MFDEWFKWGAGIALSIIVMVFTAVRNRQDKIDSRVAKLESERITHNQARVMLQDLQAPLVQEVSRLAGVVARQDDRDAQILDAIASIKTDVAVIKTELSKHG